MVTEQDQPPPLKHFRYLSSIVSDKRQERTSTSQAQQPAINKVNHYFQYLPQGDDSDDPLDFWIESENITPS